MIETLSLSASKQQINTYYNHCYPVDAARGKESQIDYHILRKEAAESAGIPDHSLPAVRVLREIIGKLYLSLLEEASNETVSPLKLLRTCSAYTVGLGGSDGLPCNEIDFEGLDERNFFLWVVNMFGDCTETEFVSGIAEFFDSITEGGGGGGTGTGGDPQVILNSNE